MSGADEDGAFDRLYERLVVQGLPKIRKPKKGKKSKTRLQGSIENTPQSELSQLPEFPQVEPIAAEDIAPVDVPAPIQASESDEIKHAKEAVLRLKLCRNIAHQLMRTESQRRISREDTLQLLALSALDNAHARKKLSSEAKPRRLAVKNARSPGRQFIRLEAVAARLYRRFLEEATGIQSDPVLHDIRFSNSTIPTWQSRIHYDRSRVEHIKFELNAVPLPPRVSIP